MGGLTSFNLTIRVGMQYFCRKGEAEGGDCLERGILCLNFYKKRQKY